MVAESADAGDQAEEVASGVSFGAVPFSALPEDLNELLRSSERTIAPDAEPKNRKRTAA
jgi:hypothetical protein